MDNIAPPHESSQSADYGEVMFSIVMPIYNGAASLAETCGFLTMQTATEFEVILVNDGSTDDTALVAKELLADRRFQFVNTENGGVCRARNIGAQHAKGEYLLFLDCDDEVTPNWLMDFKQIVSQKKCDVLFCGISFDFRNDIVNNKPVFLAGSFCVKKKLFELAGGYDEDLRYSENTELGWRIMALNPSYALVLSPNFVYRRGDDDPLKYVEKRLQAFNKLKTKHHSWFLQNPGMGQDFYQIAAVDSVRLGLYSQGKKLMWLGYKFAPTNMKALVRYFMALHPMISSRIWKPVHV
jgi:glycosyltransferase involved in cell wall biosynthesis